MNSCIYKGMVRHRRFFPRSHDFCYQVFMLYIDLDEIEEAVNRPPLWSSTRPALGRFRREDFFGDFHKPLDQAVRDLVKDKTGIKLNGPVRLLANLRYFGFIMNPICCYYCFDESGTRLEAIVAEVNNTPWGERHHYVLTCNTDKDSQQHEFQKQFHVSPFLPMDMDYKWYSRIPGKNISLHLENYQTGKKFFDATLVMKKEELTTGSLNKLIYQYPLMTLKVFAAIYWQAMKLKLKRIPFYNHPNSLLQKTH